MKVSAREYPLSEIARLCGATLHGDGSVIIRGVAPIDSANKEHISFVESKKRLVDPSLIKAGAIVVSPSLVDELQMFPLLISNRPKATFARIAQIFHGTEPPIPTGVHPTAWIEPETKIGENVGIGSFVCIASGTVIGNGTRIMAHCYIGRNVAIGSECLIYPGVIILDECKIGDRVIIHSGTVIGSDGFGYAQDETGEHVKIPQTGIVVIEDDVEIGANCTIDRATFGETRIKRGSKIDNLVTIAHNVTIGENCIIAAQSGVAGSSKIGNRVIMAGQVGIADHVTVGDNVMIGAKSGVASDIKPGMEIVGIPALPKEEFFKAQMNIRRLERLRMTVKDLESTVKRILKDWEENG